MKIPRGIYSAIYGEVNVSECVEIMGDCIEKEQSCFISVTLKSWSGRKILDPTMYVNAIDSNIHNDKGIKLTLLLMKLTF